jgi:hypothetical protein
VENCEGWRRSLKGRRFKIKGGRLFNVSEITGDLYGQAVVFSQYEEEVRASRLPAARSGVI